MIKIKKQIKILKYIIKWKQFDRPLHEITKKNLYS